MSDLLLINGLFTLDDTENDTDTEANNNNLWVPL